MTERTLNTVSSLFYLIPALIAFETGRVWFALLALIVSAVSVFFHQVKKKGPNWFMDRTRSKREHLLHYLDTLVGIIFLGFGVWIFYEREFPLNFYVALIAFIPLVLMLSRTNSPRYAVRHASWHLGTALLALLPLI